MTRFFILAIAAGALGACTPAEQAPRQSGETRAETAAETPPLYAGRWAYEAPLCVDGAWDFEETGVATAGEVSCNFTHVLAVSQTNYEVDASCTSDGATQVNHIILDVDNVAQTMHVSGGPWTAPITLMRCPNPTAP